MDRHETVQARFVDKFTKNSDFKKLIDKKIFTQLLSETRKIALIALKRLNFKAHDFRAIRAKEEIMWVIIQ